MKVEPIGKLEAERFNSETNNDWTPGHAFLELARKVGFSDRLIIYDGEWLLYHGKPGIWSIMKDTVFTSQYVPCKSE